MEILKVIAVEEDIGQRLDKVLARHAPQLSRSRLQALIEKGHVTIKGEPITDSSGKLKSLATFVIEVPPAEDAIIKPQDINLDVVYEDADLLVINKTADMVVHPAAGNYDGTLVNALLAYCGDTLSGIGGVKRPGIVHRLDKETSGLMVVAKNDAAHHFLSEQLSSRTLKRVYQAVVWGAVSPKTGRIETNIGRSKTNRKKMAVLATGGKEAITDYKVLETFGLIASHVECRLHSGRTHQIRVHMAHEQHWLIGDPLYGRPSAARFLKLQKVEEKTVQALLSFPRQALHASDIAFVHPRSKKKLEFSVNLPDDLTNLLKNLKKNVQ